MQKITLEPDQIISINGTILNAAILSEILFLQTGKENESSNTLSENYGIKEGIEQNQRFMNFLASEAYNFNNKEEALKYIEYLFQIMKYSQVFRIPGTKEIELF
jgi:hypothetical protein